MNEEMLQRYLDNDVSPQERTLIIDWIKRSSENQKTFNICKAKHVAATMESALEAPGETAYGAFKKKRRQKQYYKFAQYAALIAVLISTGFLLFGDRMDYSEILLDNKDSELLTVYSLDGFNKKILLPDGSKVQLNINSSLQYVDHFGDGHRKVVLIGEALFEIVSDSLHPFIVSTADYDVKVLGTTFNVKSYSNDTRTETTLIEGEVELLREEETPIILIPSQKAVFNKSEKKMKIEEVVSQDVIAWKTGSLVFNRTPMEQVALDLERKYNVEISIHSPKLLKYEYTGTFDNLTLEESLRLLMVSSSIDYEMLKNKIILKMKE